MNRPKKLKLIMRHDPSHAWLSVKREIVEEVVGTLTCISDYSYEQGKSLYLEEDCDAPFFLEMCAAQGIEVEIEDRYSNRRSPIRSYDRINRPSPNQQTRAIDSLLCTPVSPVACSLQLIDDFSS
jgi:hypothetical protein